MKKYLIALIVIAVIIAGVVYWQINKSSSVAPAQPIASSTSPVACTEEAKICPDGSAVGRQGPNCEFAECPAAKVISGTEDWKTYKNDKYGYEINYPSIWKMNESNNALSHDLVLGNPLEGKQTYSFGLQVLTNKDNRTSKQLAESEVKEGEVIKEVTIAGQSVYGRYNVFDIDQRSEILYLVNNGYLYTFRFPVPRENLNLANPIENNKTVYKIISTFKFTK